MLKQSGRISTVPYHIDALDINIYSLDELNYFIYNHINLVYREFFDEKLLDYIRTELCRADLADELKKLVEDGALCRELIMCVLKRSGFYKAGDMQRITGLLSGIDSMSRARRILVEADSLYKNGKLESALHMYYDIYNDRKNGGEEASFYGRIAFSIGVIYARLFMCRNANSYFEQAYELYPDPVYAKASVYMSMLNRDDEELLRTIIKYKVSDEALAAIGERVEKMEKELEEDADTKRFVSEFSSADMAGREAFLKKWKEEYYEMKS